MRDHVRGPLEPVGRKNRVLTDRFPESEARITAALHELEAEGYLHRSRVRLPSGRVTTRTTSYNRPGTDPHPLAAPARKHTPETQLKAKWTPLTEDVPALVPGVAAWLERDTHPDTTRHALTSQLPLPVKHPTTFVRSRLTTLIPPPPPLPGTTDLTPPPRRTPLTIPLQNCDTCDRAFRATHPGHCRDYRTDRRQDTCAL